MEVVCEEMDDDVPWHTGRTSARFLAVQGAYVMMFGTYTKGSLPELLDYLCELRSIMELRRLDKKLLAKILEYLVNNKQEIDDLITRHISEKWAMDRIHLVSLSVIKAGICELLCSKTDENIVINEYADIASAVLDDGEVNFVNAILNKAKSVRSLCCGDCSYNSEVANGTQNGSVTSCDGSQNYDDMLSGSVSETPSVPATSPGSAADLLTIGC